MYTQKASTVVDGQLVIDWTKGPEDADFYSPETDDNFEGFIKIDSDVVYFTTDDDFKSWSQDWFNTPEDVNSDTALIKKESK